MWPKSNDLLAALEQVSGNRSLSFYRPMGVRERVIKLRRVPSYALATSPRPTGGTAMTQSERDLDILASVANKQEELA